MSTFKEDEAPAAPQPDGQKALAAWRSEVDTLVTILCMSADRYAGYLAQGAPIVDAPRIRRHVDIDGATIDVGIVDCADRPGRGPEWRKATAARAEDARREIARQTGIPSSHWYAQAQTALSDRRLIAWLIGQRLLPQRPTAILAAERSRRAETTADQRARSADALAERMTQ